MDINKAKELYKKYQEERKEKDNKILEDIYEQLKEEINQGEKSFDIKSLYFFSNEDDNKKISIEDVFDEKLHYYGHETTMTVKFLYETFTSLGFKVSKKTWGCENCLVLSGWADDE